MTRRRARGGLLDAAFLLVCAAALVAMHRTMPSYEQKTAPFPVRGRMGDVVKGRSFALKLDRVELARTLVLPPRLGRVETRTTSGIWVIVHGQIAATRESMMLGSAAIRTRDGLVYKAATYRVSGKALLMGETNQPVLARRGVLIFEMPADRLAGAVLEAGEAPLQVMLDSLLEISLGFDEASAKAAVAGAAPEYHLGEAGKS